MYSTIAILALSSLSFFSDKEPRASLPRKTNISYTSVDSVPRPGGESEKWPAVLQADAKSLARQQGDSWKNSFKDKHVLIGLGPNGADKLKALLSASDPTTKMLYAQLMKAADNALAKPLPIYYDVAYAMTKGQTSATAQTQQWERPWGDQAAMLSVVARISDNAVYKQRLHDLVMKLCGFGSWGAGPLNADLAAAHVARGIAMAWNWDPELFSSDEKKIILDVIRTRVSMLSSGIYGANGIWWGGVYTTNVNQVSAAGAGICGVAFINDIPEAQEWLAASWLNFKQVAAHSYADGSSSEGTAYWTYGMSFILQFIEAANGVLPSYSLYDYPFLKNAAAFRVNSATPQLNEIISWGDSDPHDFTGPMHYLLRFADQYKDGQAKYMATHATPGLGGGEDVKAWAWLWSLSSVEEELPVKCDYFASTSDIINSRSGWKDDDYVFSLKSGYTNRSHSHLDAGSIALIVGSDWLLPAPKYGKGRVNGDFWDRAKGGRWKYQSNSTEANSTLIVNKQQQRSDMSARGTIDHYASYDNAMTAECDLSDVYNGVNTARRKIFHRRGEYIIVDDAVNLKEPGQVEWLIQVPPNAVVNNNQVNIQGKTGSVNIQMLTPQATLNTREPLSQNRDIAETRNTLSASMSGKTTGFVSVIEPKIHGKEQQERTYSLTPDGAVEIKTAGTEERLWFADNPSELTDKKTSASATAGFMYVKTLQDKLSEVILTDAKRFSAGGTQITSAAGFSGDLVKGEGQSWKLTIASGKNISVKGAANIYKTDGTKKTAVSGQIDGPGNYIIQ